MVRCKIESFGESAHPNRKLAPDRRIVGPHGSGALEIVWDEDAESLVGENLREIKMADVRQTSRPVQGRNDRVSTGPAGGENVYRDLPGIAGVRGSHEDWMRDPTKGLMQPAWQTVGRDNRYDCRVPLERADHVAQQGDKRTAETEAVEKRNKPFRKT